ncbi:AbrB/MazE/SpoVT family DNA-binding domain-containing protein [Deinococcus planocerae]|uniref:type II toxin-antitoxin system MazE family antitoxin n=1 Tax=Deinococcus planocerae TaxID=1737569 RepID=UPI000C7F4BF5|nr:AbrB/MazE/SpoVT family DNA-binding domain-containing protein [Deinococcus planocerae]
MTKVAVTVDAQGRLTLPPEAQARLALKPGQTVVIDVDLPVEETPVGEGENPFLRFIGSLPPLAEDSRTYYRRERGHEDP